MKILETFVLQFITNSDLRGAHIGSCPLKEHIVFGDTYKPKCNQTAEQTYAVSDGRMPSYAPPLRAGLLLRCARLAP